MAKQKTVGFLILENGSATPVSLTSVEASGGDEVELNTRQMAEQSVGGADLRATMMTMERVMEIPLPARGSVELKPGAFKVMLFRLAKPLGAGGTAALTLRFSNGVAKTVSPTTFRRQLSRVK